MTTQDLAKTPLRLWREAAGISIRELERRTGINRGRLSLYERVGNATPPDMLLIRRALTDPEPVSIALEEVVA